MTKTEFFNIIRNGLKDFPENEVNDILYDYEEHFASGLNDGKTVEEIIEELGNPYDIVEQYKSTNSYSIDQKSKSTSSLTNTTIIILILVGIICFPAITGLGGIIIGIIATLCFVPLGFTFAGIGILLGDLGVSVLGIVNLPDFITDFPTSSVILFTIGSLLSTILGIIISVYLVKAFIILIKKIIELFKEKSKKEDVNI
ncbi:MAG: DUF1700 domain-containing protein [Clostridium sp.]|nr:DUF1700 domain-containing protein [Clostridium sp.]MDY3827672.1 DUF1700 domain-containing protein [Clostridium sp.]